VLVAQVLVMTDSVKVVQVEVVVALEAALLKLNLV
jgi:hypothetical protein